MFTGLILVCMTTDISSCSDYFAEKYWYKSYDVCMEETKETAYERYLKAKESGLPDPNLLTFECFEWKELNDYAEETSLEDTF